MLEYVTSKMKRKIIKAILKGVVGLYPLRVKVYFYCITDSIYNLWVSSQFKSIGENTLICKRLNLIGGKSISVGSNSVIARGCILQAHGNYLNQAFNPSIEIGDYCNIGEESMITSIFRVKIGDGLLTGRRVTITDNSHGRFILDNLKKNPCQRKLVSKGPVIIGNNVWIGQNATIISANIGDGAVIGANAVVTHDVPPYSLVVGNPAKIVKRIDESTGDYCDI